MVPRLRSTSAYPKRAFSRGYHVAEGGACRRFYNGTAFSKAIVEFDQSLPNDFEGVVDYAVGILAWASYGPNHVDGVHLRSCRNGASVARYQ